MSKKSFSLRAMCASDRRRPWRSSVSGILTPPTSRASASPAASRPASTSHLSPISKLSRPIRLPLHHPPAPAPPDGGGPAGGGRGGRRRAAPCPHRGDRGGLGGLRGGAPRRGGTSGTEQQGRGRGQVGGKKTSEGQTVQPPVRC